ncbi:hypothetical protein AB4Y96_16300 [Phyllobacterium sp. TAF24]|uniref:hypothetical protein n=1 Tax=Phyllobacterium sp. TAF24 TaxID=3233068 RepID=UPI003F9E4A54
MGKRFSQGLTFEQFISKSPFCACHWAVYSNDVGVEEERFAGLINGKPYGKPTVHLLAHSTEELDRQMISKVRKWLSWPQWLSMFLRGDLF